MKETHRGNYTIKELFIEDRVPSLMIKRGKGSRPMVVYVHGAFLWKEYDLGLLLRMVDRGLNVLSIDAARHGKRERFTARGLLQLFKEAVESFPTVQISVFVETAKDLPVVIDYLEFEEGIEQVGVAGYSMGGFIALAAASLDKRIRAVASFGAGGDWRFLFERSSFPKLMGFNTVTGKLEDSTLELISKWDPIERIDRI
ncbi:MAG: alpha/beta fold hydrolase, partial [Candidatus Bathyarchaeia archaeon]